MGWYEKVSCIPRPNTPFTSPRLDLTVWALLQHPAGPRLLLRSPHNIVGLCAVHPTKPLIFLVKWGCSVGRFGYVEGVAKLPAAGFGASQQKVQKRV